MIRKLLPVLMIVVAGIAGLFAGNILRGDADAKTDHAKTDGETHATDTAPDAGHGIETAKADHKSTDGAGIAYFRFPSQFFVPVMHGDRLDGMMVLTLTVEMPQEVQEDVFKQEFRLRDAFLRTLLIHANTGGFDGNYTIEPRMRRLREALMKTADEVSGGQITDVLIEDIARQDAA